MPTYSVSRLRKFDECPKAYEFKYIERLEVERVRNIYFFLGSRVHETLEDLHNGVDDGDSFSVEEVLKIFEEKWDEEWGDDVKIFKDELSPEHYKNIGKECVKNYFDIHYPFAYETVGNEISIEPKVSANGDEYKFFGYIDRLAKDGNGKFEVHDYKTSKNLPEPEVLRDKNQLPLYQLGVEQEYDAEDVELIWHYVRYGEDIKLNYSEEDLENLQEKLVKKIKKIEDAREREEFPTKRWEGANCNWCDYKDHCPEFNDKKNTLMDF